MVLGQRATRVFEDVVIPHPVEDLLVGSGYVPVHVGILSRVEEPGQRPVVVRSMFDDYVLRDAGGSLPNYA